MIDSIFRQNLLHPLPAPSLKPSEYMRNFACHILESLGILKMPDGKLSDIQLLFIALDGLYRAKQPPCRFHILQSDELLHGLVRRKTLQQIRRKSPADRCRPFRKAFLQKLSVPCRHIILWHSVHIGVSFLQLFHMQLHFSDNMPLTLSLPADPQQLLFFQTFHEKVNPLIFRRALVKVSRQCLFRKSELDMYIPSVLSRGEQAGLISIQQPVQDHSVILYHCNTFPRSSPSHRSSLTASPPQKD